MFCLVFAVCDTKMIMIFKMENFLSIVQKQTSKEESFQREFSRANNKNRKIENEPVYSHTHTLIKTNWNFKQT